MSDTMEKSKHKKKKSDRKDKSATTTDSIAPDSAVVATTVTATSVTTSSSSSSSSSTSNHSKKRKSAPPASPSTAAATPSISPPTIPSSTPSTPTTRPTSATATTPIETKNGIASNVTDATLALLRSQFAEYQAHLHGFKPSAVVMVATMDHLEIVARELASCPLLALDCEGVNMSRNGRLTILQICTARTVYCIDIVALSTSTPTPPPPAVVIGGGGVAAASPPPAISNRPRLTALLNSFLAGGSTHAMGRVPRLLVWDVRNDSDALYHQLGVTLGCILDLQLLSIAHQRFVKQLPCRARPGLAKAVDSVFADRVRHYGVQQLSLKVHAEFERARLDKVPESKHPWVVRPLRSDFQLYAAFGVLFHLPLALRLWDHMCRSLPSSATAATGTIVLPTSLPVLKGVSQPIEITPTGEHKPFVMSGSNGSSTNGSNSTDAPLNWLERTLIASQRAVEDFRDRVVAVKRPDYGATSTHATVNGNGEQFEDTKLAPHF